MHLHVCVQGSLWAFPGIPQSSAMLKIGCDSILKYQEARGLLDDVMEVSWENVVIKWVACGDKKPLK